MKKRHFCETLGWPVLLWLLLVGAPVAAQTLATAPIATECLAVETAFAHNEQARLSTMELVQPRWRALRAFRLAAIHIPAADKPLARKAVRDGLKIVEKRLAELPAQRRSSSAQTTERVELLLLGAMLDGQYMLIDRWRLLHNGWRGLRRLRRAEALQDANPRAALIRGTAKVVAPWALGGSPQEAIDIFLGVDTTAALCENGNWAQVDVLNWLGRAYAKLNQPDAARSAYEQALLRSPNNHWVQLALRGAGYEWTEHGVEEDRPGSSDPER